MFTFFKKRKEDKPKKTVYQSNLTITFRDNKKLSWTADSERPFASNIIAWRTFYKWYFGRSGQHYLMQYRNGETMIQRDDIRFFETTLGSKEVDA